MDTFKAILFLSSLETSELHNFMLTVASIATKLDTILPDDIQRSAAVTMKKLFGAAGFNPVNRSEAAIALCTLIWNATSADEQARLLADIRQVV
jgi:hypothetical protein